MDLAEFSAELRQNIDIIHAENGEGPDRAFLEYTTEEYLVKSEYLAESINLAYYEGVGARRRRLRVDGYYEDPAEDSLALFIVDYADSPGTLTRTAAENGFKALKNFAEEALNTDLYLELEPSRPEADLVDRLRELAQKGRIVKYKLFMLTNAVKSKNIKSLTNLDINGVPAECILWDMQRFLDIALSTNVKEPIEIDFADYVAGGIPSLAASAAENQLYKSYLCVIPGRTLAQIYNRYGSRLLEGNVRSFLSTKRKVNKKIRETILNEPTRFFAYNNGIAATALSLKFATDASGLHLMSASDFQIINGGQTTASLAMAQLKDKADLENIYVQMKVTQIGEMSQDDADRLVHDISRSSNSQNAVSEADFFSTSPFHILLEKISRRVLAPAQEGVQYETHWFYERARGQYQQAQMTLTPAKKKQFQLKNPKSQVIQKTDLAKYRYSWEEHPDLVSRGAQTNFMKFADEISKRWDEDNTAFNEHWFKESVAMAILFKETERIVSHASWYGKSYRANIVTYTLAMLHHIIAKAYRGQSLDLMKLWTKQRLPEELEPVIDELAHRVSDYLLDDSRLVQNVTQWSKKEICWKKMKEQVHMELPASIEYLILANSARCQAKKEAKRVQRFDNEVSALKRVIEVTASWDTIADTARRLKLVRTAKEEQALKAARKIKDGILPTDFQAETLIILLDRLRENGQVY